MKKTVLLSAVLLLVLSCGTARKSSECGNGDICIYYDNDVHCHIDGYDEIAALRASTPNSLTVSVGDFAQGGSLGAISKGGYIVELMNAAGYDVVTLGNHEFDYGMPRLAQLTDSLNASVTVCNLYDLRSGKRLYDEFVMREIDGVKVAFVGVATPYSFFSSTPTYFQDESGKYIYSLCADNIYSVAEKSARRARRAGADYVIGLTHVGIDSLDAVNSKVFIASTTGFDAILDGHSHSTIPGEWLSDRKGKRVLLTSTGTAFANIGRLTISSRGDIHSELIPTSECRESDSTVLALEKEIRARYEAMGARPVGYNECSFVYADASCPRLVRLKETPLGDFCADAIRSRTATDIAIIGGGSIRAALPHGRLTYNDLVTMYPFGNTVAKGVMSGQEVLDMLEFSVHVIPVEFGGFLQVSGIVFDVDSSVPSGVTVDADKAFVGINGARRVQNVRIISSDGSLVPIDPKASYSISGSKYTLVDHGDGYTMLGGPNISDTGILDLQLIEDYITENLGGIIPAAFDSPSPRIRVLK